MSYATVRDGLKIRLATISALTVYDTIPGDIVTPAAVVAPGAPAVTYDVTQSEQVLYTFAILVFASKADERTGQDRVDSYIEPTGALSIKAAIEGDDTLGGVADSTRVVSVDNYGESEVAGVKYWGARFAVEVFA